MTIGLNILSRPVFRQPSTFNKMADGLEREHVASRGENKLFHVLGL
jgi:hypothetical protein